MSNTEAPPTRRAAPRRFALLRYFSLTSLVCIMLAAIALGLLYRNHAVNEMIDEARFDNAAFAHVLSIAFRDDIAALLRQAGREGMQDVLERFDRSVREHAHPFRAAKVKIYAPDGTTVFSTRREEIGIHSADNPGVIAGLRGEVSSGLVHRDQFNTFDHVLEERDLLQSYLPVRTGSEAGVIGVFELYSDMTALLARIRTTEQVVMSSVAGTMLALYLLLFVVVRRADRILRRQDDALRAYVRKIDEQNLELEGRVRARTEALQAANRKLVAEIAEREAAERELELSRQRAWQQETLAAIGRLAAGIVHEIGNPLAAVRGLAELATDDLAQGDGEATRRTLGQLVAHVHRIESITGDVSRFSVPESLEPELIDLNELLKLVVNVLRYDAKFSGIRFDLNLAHDLPAAMGVPSQLWQVFNNLLLNAADAIQRKAGPDRTVTVHTERSGSDGLLRVHDCGDGMDEDAIAKAFEPFQTTKAPGQGMGIGLSLCYSIIQGHAGSIGIASKPGLGTTVSVTLPLHSEEA